MRPVESTATLAAALATWGPNEFQIPLPPFWELFKVQLLAPFFIFQVRLRTKEPCPE
jgi:hypothetical protein